MYLVALLNASCRLGGNILHSWPVPFSDDTQAVLMPSEDLPSDSVLIRGFEFGKEACTLDALMSSMLSTGLQASALGQAIVEVNRMVRKRDGDLRMLVVGDVEFDSQGAEGVPLRHSQLGIRKPTMQLKPSIPPSPFDPSPAGLETLGRARARHRCSC